MLKAALAPPPNCPDVSAWAVDVIKRGIDDAVREAENAICDESLRLYAKIPARS
jgi:hypothetical protein